MIFSTPQQVDRLDAAIQSNMSLQVCMQNAGADDTLLEESGASSCLRTSVGMFSALRNTFATVTVI